MLLIHSFIHKPWERLSKVLKWNFFSVIKKQSLMFLGHNATLLLSFCLILLFFLYLYILINIAYLLKKKNTFISTVAIWTIFAVVAQVAYWPEWQPAAGMCYPSSTLTLQTHESHIKQALRYHSCYGLYSHPFPAFQSAPAIELRPTEEAGTAGRGEGGEGGQTSKDRGAEARDRERWRKR